MRFGRALPQPIGKLDDPPQKAEATGPRTDYLAMLRADYDRRLLEQARPASYADLGALEPGFDQSRFFTVFSDLTGAPLRGSATQEAAAFWLTLGPLPETLVRIGLEHAVRLRGTARHVRVYLSILRTFVLSQMQS